MFFEMKNLLHKKKEYKVLFLLNEVLSSNFTDQWP